MKEDRQFGGCSTCREHIHRCEKLLRQLQASFITLDEFAYNVALDLLSTCDTCLRRYLDSLPDAEVAHLNGYLQVTLETEGYLPFVRPFVVNFSSEKEIYTKTQENEPKVNRLRHSANERVARIRT